MPQPVLNTEIGQQFQCHSILEANSANSGFSTQTTALPIVVTHQQRGVRQQHTMLWQPVDGNRPGASMTDPVLVRRPKIWYTWLLCGSTVLYLLCGSTVLYLLCGSTVLCLLCVSTVLCLLYGSTVLCLLWQYCAISTLWQYCAMSTLWQYCAMSAVAVLCSIYSVKVLCYISCSVEVPCYIYPEVLSISGSWLYCD